MYVNPIKIFYGQLFISIIKSINFGSNRLILNYKNHSDKMPPKRIQEGVFALVDVGSSMLEQYKGLDKIK